VREISREGGTIPGERVYGRVGRSTAPGAKGRAYVSLR